MSKYGWQRRKQQRRDREGVLSAQTLPWAYDKSEALDRQDLSEEVSATSRISPANCPVPEEQGMLVEFAVVYSVLIDGMWIERLCIDHLQPRHCPPPPRREPQIKTPN